jgi:hypothetical protein
VRPSIGKSQVIHCLEAYQHGHGLQDVKATASLSENIGGFIRKTSLIPVISDFLFDDPRHVLEELSSLNSVHDVFLVLIDSAFAFDLPPVSAWWIDAFDVETGRSRLISRRAVRALARRAAEWQNEVERTAKHLDIDVLRLGIDEAKSDIALMEFVIERRLRKR